MASTAGNGVIFWNALEELRKATVSVVMSVCLSVCLSVWPSVLMEQQGYQLMYFHEIL